ncbi:Ribosomal RNA large subunit methyltransferase E [archaeon HR01]|nr:Ribosomal RNA large subunit methyltransferase E [archaeon HR01]
MNWLQSRREDPYYRMAKEMGLPSRAAFKLVEIQSRWRVIKRGDYVLDLGAAPGGMTAVAAREAGEKGLVVAVDLADVKVGGYENVKVVKRDVFSEGLEYELMGLTSGRFFDVVISDLSPKHIGDFDLLVLQQLDLLKQVRHIAFKTLRRGGNLVMKSFEHPEMRRYERETSRMFYKFERFVPRSSPRGSAEFFQIYLGFRRRGLGGGVP